MLPTFAVAVDHVCRPLSLPLELFQIIGKGVVTIQTNSNILFIVILLLLVLLALLLILLLVLLILLLLILLLPLLILLLLILLLPLLILRWTLLLILILLLLILLLILMIILRLLPIPPADPLDLQKPRHVHGLTLGRERIASLVQIGIHFRSCCSGDAFTPIR